MMASIKRLIDVLAASTGLVLLSPVMFFVAGAIRLKLGHPIFYRQARPGYQAKPFTLIKFRTLVDAYGADGEPLPDAERLTPFGSCLRRWSLDELPQLWNVFKGEMSLVGPRPLLMEYLPRYTPEQMRRHEVRPGITGWAQINGRNAISWDEKFSFDTWYVDNWSLALDCKILIWTVIKVTRRQGISSAGEVTAARFEGVSDGVND